jgi:hypothetical protein
MAESLSRSCIVKERRVILSDEEVTLSRIRLDQLLYIHGIDTTLPFSQQALPCGSHVYIQRWYETADMSQGASADG